MTDKEKDSGNNNKKSIGLNSLTDNLISDTENAYIPDEVRSEINEAAETLNNPNSEIIEDADGIVFDPELHAADKDGNPSLTKLGKFRKKSGVSKVALKDAKKADEIQREKQGVILSAQFATHTFVNTTTMIFGDEWQPEIDKETGYNEYNALNSAFYNYLEAKDIKDLPPSMALAMALGTYSMKRFNKPVTKSQFTKIKENLIGKFYTWKSKRGNKKNGAHSSTRADRKRENNDSQKDSKTSE